jgi:uncharacterized membrane protein YidH (DUF202 family)
LEISDDRALQPERTGLAWVRTLVVVAGTWGLVAFHMFYDHTWIAAAMASSTIAALVLVTCGWLAAARGREARLAMDEGRSVTSPMPLLLLSLSCAVVAIVAFASTLLMA